MAITVPFRTDPVSGRHHHGCLHSLLCEVLVINRALGNNNCLHITGLENKPDLLHDMGTYVPVVKDGDFVFLDLCDLLVGKSHGSAEDATG